MHSNEKISLWIFAVFFFAVFFSLLFSHPSITGFAIKEELPKLPSYGHYLPTPHIVVPSRIDESFYESALASLQSISSCTLSGNTLDLCMAQESSATTLWSTDCEKGTEKIFYEIAQFIERCAQSSDTDCLCSYSLEKSAQQIQQFGLDKKHEFFFVKENGAHILNTPLKKSELRYQLTQYPQAASSPNSIVVAYDKSGYSQGIVEFSDSNGNKRPFVNQKSLTLYKSQNAIEYARADGQSLKKMSDDSQIAIARQCALPPKEYVRFCVTDNSKKFLVYDEVEGTVAERPITIRFASKLSNTPPPQLTNLRAIDAPKESKSILLSWDESPALDVEEYTIYYADSRAVLQNPLSSFIAPSVQQITIKKDAIQTIQAIPDLSQCTYKKDQRSCTYPSAPTGLLKNTLYRMDSSSQKTLALKIEVPSDAPYSFGVIARDRDGLAIDNVKQGEELPIAETASKNDVAMDSTRLFINRPQTELLAAFNTQTRVLSLDKGQVPSLALDGTQDTLKEYAAFYSLSSLDKAKPLSSTQGNLPLSQNGAKLELTLLQPGSYEVTIVALNNRQDANLMTYSPNELNADILKITVP